MHVGSTQTIRLPNTTYCAGKAAESALEELLPTGLQIGGKLPYLNALRCLSDRSSTIAKTHLYASSCILNW